VLTGRTVIVLQLNLSRLEIEDVFFSGLTPFSAMLAVFIIYGIYHLYVCTIKLSVLGVQKSSVRLKLQMLRTLLN